LTWIKNKLAKACIQAHEKSNGAFYVLDATNLSSWDEIQHDAMLKVKAFLNEQPNLEVANADLMKMFESMNFKEEKWKKYSCSVCIDKRTKTPKICNGAHEWQTHLNSSRHKKNCAYFAANGSGKNEMSKDNSVRSSD
jgi:hypothetical protein